MQDSRTAASARARSWPPASRSTRAGWSSQNEWGSSDVMPAHALTDAGFFLPKIDLFSRGTPKKALYSILDHSAHCALAQ